MRTSFLALSVASQSKRVARLKPLKKWYDGDGSVEQGYCSLPAWPETLAKYLNGGIGCWCSSGDGTLTYTDVVENRCGQLALPVRRGKADQNGEGRVVTLSKSTVGLLVDWIAAAGIENGTLILPLYSGTA